MADDRVKEIRDKHLDEYISDDIQTLLSEIDRLRAGLQEMKAELPAVYYYKGD